MKSTSSSTASLDQQQLPQKSAPKNLIFAIVAMGLFMGSLDLTIVATALPSIHRSIHATLNWAGWTITIYGLGIIVSLPIAGKLSDQFGRKRIFLYGIAVFTASSLACGFATNIYMLIAFRALQSLGGGTLQPSAAGIVSDHFGANRDRALGLFVSINSSGQIAGPIFGGLFVGYLSWRWIFFVNVPIGIALLILTIRLVPESRQSSAGKVDFKGLGLLAGFILATIFGITSLGTGSVSPLTPTFLFPELCAGVLFYFFIRHTKYASAPFVPGRLLYGRGFIAANVVNLLCGACCFGVASLTPLYAEERFGLKALDAGTLLTARAIGMMTLASLSTFALRRIGYRKPIYIGLVVVAIGTLLMSFGPRLGISDYAWLAVGAALTGIGNGCVAPAMRNACLQLAPDDVAAIMGLRGMFIQLGTIFFVSVTTAILTRSADPGLTQAHVLWVVCIVIAVVILPIVYWIPEHKGSW